jgi:glutamate-1-semialdehyde 2,1-aminomutase
MKLGGREQTDSPRVFLLSTTHGAETHALAASIATMRVYQNEPVIEHLYNQGQALRLGIAQAVTRHGLGAFMQVTGRACCLAYTTLDQDRVQSQAFRTLFLQETIKRGVLMPSLVVSYTHSDEDVARTIEAVDGALGVYKQALENGVGNYLVGRPSEVVFRRFNSQVAPVRNLELAAHG